MFKPVASPWRALGVAACAAVVAVGGLAAQTPDIQEQGVVLVGCSEKGGEKVRLGGLRPEAAPPVQLKVKLRAKQSEADLRKELAALPEVKVGSEGQPKAVPTPWVPDKAIAPTFVMNKETLARRTDLAMLPVRMGKDCEVEQEQADRLRLLGRDLRRPSPSPVTAATATTTSRWWPACCGSTSPAGARRSWRTSPSRRPCRR